jgi:hypothetical protein
VERYCELCYQPLTGEEKGPECSECQYYDNWWKSLTPAQRQEELDLISNYFAEINTQP